MNKNEYEENNPSQSVKIQSNCSFTMNPDSFSNAQFKNLTSLKLSNTQLDSKIFDHFISRFSRLQDLNLDGNHIEMVKSIPKSIKTFSILHNPLNECNFDTLKAILNMKTKLKSYNGITMKCFGSEITPEEAYVQLSIIAERKVIEI